VAKLGAYLTLPEEIEKEIVILKTFVCEQVNILETNKLQCLMRQH
jgi:hypothetical protein